MTAFTAVLLHQCTMDTGTDFSVVSTGQREKAVVTAVKAVL